MQVSNGELKQWTLLRVADDEFYLDEGDRPDFEHSKIKVMRVEDHDRIVAELKAEVERLKRANQVVPRDAGLLALNGKFRDTIATQAKVIEVLKACILKEDKRCGIWHDGRKAIEQAETIERGEA